MEGLRGKNHLSLVKASRGKKRKKKSWTASLPWLCFPSNRRHMHAFTSPLSLDCTDQLLLPHALFLARFDLNRRFGGGSYLFANSLSGVNRPEHRCEHVEMDFMKLFGTVIAVLFHPGSTSKINGKNSERRSHTLSSASALETTRAYLFILLPSETYTEFFSKFGRAKQGCAPLAAQNTF